MIYCSFIKLLQVGAFKTALTFVDSVSEIFGPLLTGHRVVVIPKVSINFSTICHSDGKGPQVRTLKEGLIFRG